MPFTDHRISPLPMKFKLPRQLSFKFYGLMPTIWVPFHAVENTRVEFRTWIQPREEKRFNNLYMLVYTNIVPAFAHAKSSWDESVTAMMSPLSSKSVNNERFNCNKVDIHSWSWCYRSCWHQACPSVFAILVISAEVNLEVKDTFPSKFLVTTSPEQNGVIYAPAAFLRSESCVQGFLSGVKPSSSDSRSS